MLVSKKNRREVRPSGSEYVMKGVSAKLSSDYLTDCNTLTSAIYIKI